MILSFEQARTLAVLANSHKRDGYAEILLESDRESVNGDVCVDFEADTYRDRYTINADGEYSVDA